MSYIATGRRVISSCPRSAVSHVGKTQVKNKIVMTRLIYSFVVVILLVMDTTSSMYRVNDGGTIAGGKTADAPSTVGVGHTLAKTVFDSRLRLMVMVGIEGSGHHFLRAVYQNMFRTNDELSLSATECVDSSPFSTKDSMVNTTMYYAESYKRGRSQLQTIARQGQSLQEPGHLAALCYFVSYPTNFGAQKVMQYLDLRMLAEVAEDEGVDLRAVYLKRSAHDLIIADSVHRHIHRARTPLKGASEDRQFIEYMRILLTDIGVVHSFLGELDPAFIVCHEYNLSGQEEEASKIAEFVAPNDAVAAMYKQAMLHSFSPHHHKEEKTRFEGADVIEARLQRKLDAFESIYCG